MLTYVSLGERRFGITPTRVHPRVNWEFMAVLTGTMAATTQSQPYPELRTSSLWVFPPSVPHGWIGKGEEPCQVLVLHVGTVPEPLSAIAQRAKGLEVPLEPRDRVEITAVGAVLHDQYRFPTDRSALYVQRCLCDLALIALKGVPVRSLQADPAEHRSVERAIAWYRENLRSGPTLREMAKAVNMTESHLRRLFHAVRGQSPRQCMEEVRMESAQNLLRYGSHSMEELAELCGFSEASALSRAFRRRFGVSPAHWRDGALTVPGEHHNPE